MAQQKLISRARGKERGVPVNYVHVWNYKGKWVEKKVSPKTWAIRFRASKNKVNLRGFGGLPIGSRVRWRIVAVQDAIKVKNGMYMTDMKGFKQLVLTNIPIYGINKSAGGSKMPKVVKRVFGKIRTIKVFPYTPAGYKRALAYAKAVRGAWVVQGKSNKKMSMKKPMKKKKFMPKKRKYGKRKMSRKM